MPLTLAKAPGLDSLQPLAQEVEANQPPFIDSPWRHDTANGITPDVVARVDGWRKDVWDAMPSQLRQRPDAAVLLDKSLHALAYESGGNERAVGDGGAAWGGWQDHHIAPGSDRAAQIQSMWNLVAKNPDQFTDWGEGATYNGQKFGAFGSHPYNNGGSGAVTGSALNTLPIRPQNTPTLNYSSEMGDWDNKVQPIPNATGETSPTAIPNAQPGQETYQNINAPNLQQPLNTGDVPYDTGGGGLVDAQRTYNERLKQSQERQQYQDQLTETYNNGGKDSIAGPLLEQQLQKMTPVDPSTGGVWNGDYRITQPAETSPYVDESARGTVRGQLEARREGKDKLGNAVLAGATALPLIAGGPIAMVGGTVGSEIGAEADKKLGIGESLNVPLLGKQGPFSLIGGAIGGSKGGEGEGLADSTVRSPTIKPNLRIVQPGETPVGAMGIAGGTGPKTTNWTQIVENARNMGMSDAEIESAFPGALDAAGGINRGAQTAARTDAEQAAKGAAAKRTYNRVYQEYYDNLKSQGYNDAEAKQIATGLASKEARSAAAQAPEALPEQKPNVLATDETRQAMKQANERLRNPGSAAVSPRDPTPEELEIMQSQGYSGATPQGHLPAWQQGTPEQILERARIARSQRPLDPGLSITERNRALIGKDYPETPAEHLVVLDDEADRLNQAGRTSSNATRADRIKGDIAEWSKRLGDPAAEIRRGLQGQTKSQLQQAIDEEQQKNKRRTPEENARLRAERTAGPLNQPKTLQDRLAEDTKGGKFEPTTGEPIPEGGKTQLAPPEQLNMLDDVLGQMSMQDVVTPGHGKLDIPPNTTGAAMKLDAASVAERARLSAEYTKNTGGPQLSETQFHQQWDAVKTARDGGRRWPENWTQEKINAFQKLEQGLTGEANPAAVGKDVTGGLFPGPLLEAGPTGGPLSGTAQASQALREGAAAQGFERSQNVARQNVEQAAARDTARFPAEGEAIDAAKGLKPDQQSSLLNKDWKPGQPIAESAARGVSDLVSLPRSLQTRFDFSYPFRQGLLFVRRQGEFWDAFGTGLKSFWKDEDWKRAVEQQYMNAPYNPQTLKLTRWTGGNMAEREELFYNRLIDKFPAPLKKVFDASEEAATIFINKLRSDVTNNVARKWLREGLTANDPEFIQDLNIFGNYVNRATGYGNLGELEKSVGLLNTVFYGARRNIAMVQAPGYLFNASARVRVEAWKDFLGLFGMGASTLGLAQLAGIGDVNTFNPDSADWGKLKIGSTRLDIWGGYQQLARTVYKLADGQIKSPGDFKDFWQTALPFLGNKLSPQAGAAVSTLPEDARRVIQPVDRPFKITDALAPLAWQGLVQAVREDGAIAGAISVTGLLGTGTQTYQSKADVRDQVAQQGITVDGKLVKPESYEAADRQTRAAIDKSEAVQKYDRENPSAYKQDKDRRETDNPFIQDAKRAEAQFKAGQPLGKPIQEYWRDETTAKLTINRDLADQYKDMFANFDKSKYDKAVEGYFSPQLEKRDPITGDLDWDATGVARDEYVKTLPQDQQDWINQSLKANEENKSDTHQKYDRYIKERKTAGYFDIDKLPPADQAKARVALDQKNPLQDALNWYWKGGTVDTTRVPTLNSPTAVEYALQLDGKRPVKYAGLERDLNQSPQVTQAYRDYATRIQNYYTITVPKYQEQESQDLFGKPYAQLDRAQQARVASSILTQVRRGSPELEAALQFFGDTPDGNGDYVVSADAAPYLRQMVSRYGNLPVNAKNKSGRPSQFLVRQ